MNVSTEWVRGFVESFVSSYIDARFPKIMQRVEALEGKGGDYGVTSADLAQLVHAVEGMKPYTVIRTEEYERLLSIEAENSNRQASDTFDGRCVVPEARILRWERIERTAKDLAEHMGNQSHGGQGETFTLWWLLDEALKP